MAVPAFLAVPAFRFRFSSIRGDKAQKDMAVPAFRGGLEGKKGTA